VILDERRRRGDAIRAADQTCLARAHDLVGGG
jgi:hypothetical protein